jgi:hypothetical protein
MLVLEVTLVFFALATPERRKLCQDRHEKSMGFVASSLLQGKDPFARFDATR